MAHAATWALIPHCNVPNPPTDEEDTTMALTIWATIPMNMWIHKITKCWNQMLKTRCTEVEHTQMQLFIIHNGSKHMFLQAFNMFITFINKKYDCRSKMDKITYLMKSLFRNQLRPCNVPPNHRPACSLISQQCCHPRAGHDSPRNKGTSRLTHSQGCTKHSQANTVGFIRLSTR